MRAILSVNWKSFTPMIALALLGGLLIMQCDEATTEPSTTVEDIKQELQKYTDVSQALQDGYVNTLEFEQTPDGGMGVHFVNMNNAGTDPEKPFALMYDVTESGQYEFMGVEYFVPENAVDETPELFGKEFDGPMEGHTPDMPRHYDLHLWAFQENPNGRFAQFNPEVSVPSWWDQYETALNTLRQYADTSQAKAAGYMNTGECEATEEGAMGIHFVNPAVQTLDPAKPFALMYVPTSDTSMALLGAEYFVPADSVDSAPMMFGQVFQGPMEGHTPNMPRHYDLHLWALRTNPMGMFAEWNPMVSCP